MRQLAREGWVHNRVRMVVASFLVKDLHVHWSHGARHFLHHLRDGDVGSNNHGWQWVAGTGTDPAPYFRVFNPVVQAEKFDLGQYFPAAVENGRFDGKLYALPETYQYQAVLIYYNKDMFDAAGIQYPEPYPPMTPEEFVDIACQLTDQQAGVWGGAASDPLAYAPWETFFSDDGRTALFNSPEAIQQFEVLASGYERGCIPTSNILDPWEQGRDYFASEQLAMVITDFQDLDKVENAGIDYGSTASPTPVGEEPYFFVWTDSVGVMASSDASDAAMDFIAYLTTEGQRLRANISGDLPLNLEIAEEVNWAEGVPGRQDGMEVLSNARTAVFVPNRWDVIGPYYDAWDFVLSGEKTPEQALSDANAAIQDNLDEAWEDWEDAA
jgi:ABC-type glycerol-3-phosphate transport system substrate-binding protein